MTRSFTHWSGVTFCCDGGRGSDDCKELWKTEAGLHLFMSWQGCILPLMSQLMAPAKPYILPVFVSWTSTLGACNMQNGDVVE